MTRSRAIERLARHMSKSQDDPGPIENTGNKKNPEWALDAFKYPQMTCHNRSIDWIVGVSNTLGAEIRTEVDGGYRHFSESFEILIRGRDSGILYRIEVAQSNKQLEIMSKRAAEFAMTSREAAVVLYAFRDLMDIRVSWWDISTSRWEYICMRDELNELTPHWPGDGVVSMLYLLHNDLEQSTELSLRTLRHEMRKALVIYWFNGMANSLMTMGDVTDFSEGLRELQGAETEEDFEEVRRVMLDKLQSWFCKQDEINSEGVVT